MKKQIFNVLFLCGFLVSVSVQAPFDYDTGDGSAIFKPQIKTQEEISARLKFEQEVAKQQVKQLKHTRKQRDAAADKAKAIIRKEANGGTIIFDQDNQNSRYNQLRRQFLTDGTMPEGEVVSKGVPLQQGTTFDYHSNEGDKHEGPQSNEPTTPSGRMEKSINDAWFKFDQAKGEAKLSEAKNLLGLSGDPSQESIKAAYKAKLDAFKELEQNTNVVDVIDKRLQAARDYLVNDANARITDSSFDIIERDDIPKSELNKNIQLDSFVRAKLTDKDIADINDIYIKLKPEQREVFVKNLHRFAKYPNLEISEIITKSYDEAMKKPQSVGSKLWNAAVRFWNKISYGKTEEDYVNTVITQALDGDENSSRILMDENFRNKITAQNVKKFFKPLDVVKKQAIIKIMQDAANKIIDEKNDEFKSAVLEDTEKKEGNADPEFLTWWTNTLNKSMQDIKETYDSLIESLKPMCSKDQNILSFQDRHDFYMETTIVDFSKFRYDPSENIMKQLETFKRTQPQLTMPKHRETVKKFNKALEDAMIENYNYVPSITSDPLDPNDY